ncbi:MAG: hypothetical protein ABJE95_38005 [Byssovorax sp.]
MLSLDQTAIHELHAAVLSAGLVRSRDALLTGIDSVFVGGLDSARNPADQILFDLEALNKAGELADETVPLRIWLANAVQLAGPRREAAIFARIREGLAPAAAVHAKPGSIVPPPAAMSQEQLLDILVNLLPAQLEMLIFKLGVPPAYLSGTTAPQATRSIEVLRWAAQEKRLAEVERRLAAKS